MTDHTELSRRKVLGGLTAIGGASALGGMGTLAYFSDEEEFANNQLTAGELDLKVSWAEHYYRDQDEASQYVVDDVGPADVDLPVPDTSDGQDIELTLSDRAAFQDATLQEQFPDEETRLEIEEGTTDLCEALADVPEDLDGPVIELDDVKPGDFGEVTFDLALCSNPGYLWLNGSILDSAENGLTEPEAKDEDEDEAAVELVDELRLIVWYDNDCDNLVSGVEEIVFNTTLREAMDSYLATDPASGDYGLPLHGDMTSLISPGTNYVDFDGGGTAGVVVRSASDPSGGGGSVAHATSFGDSVSDFASTVVTLDDPIALGDLDDGSGGTTLTYDYFRGGDHGHASPDGVWLLIEEADGTRHTVRRTSNDQHPSSGFSARPGGQWHTRNVHAEARGNPEYNPGFNWFEMPSNTNIGGGGPTSDLASVYGADAEVLRMGATVGSGAGGVTDLYLRNPAVGGAGFGPFDTGVNEVEEGRACFPAEERRCIGVAWYLPIDHGNEVQGDSVTFDLGFYTEQCRHNPGGGQAAE